MLWVPYVNSSSVSGGWAPRSGSTKVDAKMGLRVRLGPVDCRPLLVLLAACSARDDAVSESEKGGCVKFTSVIHSKLSVGGNYFSDIKKYSRHERNISICPKKNNNFESLCQLLQIR